MIDSFRALYGSADGVRIFRAPGRVNLIGEHTDYNLGFVLPVALDLATSVATAPTRDGKLRIHSEDRAETREFEIASLASLPPAHHWTDYPIGVARELLQLGIAIEPANLLIRSTVPEGSGLSSSAALEVSSALAFLRGRTLDLLELAKLCQRAERNFVGMPCGIMDQYISVFGRDHSAVEIDCRSLAHRLVALPTGIAFVAVNTMVKHALSGSAYRDRVAECAAACQSLGVASLRDITPDQFADAEDRLADPVRRRARHVVTEDARVDRFVDAASRREIETMGRLMIASHRSLQYDYEVSCAELDYLVDTALLIDGVIGSRMTGGGFGGCTVTLLREDAVESFRTEIAAKYHAQYGIAPAIYNCTPSAGAGEVSA
ncbi:MAG TPA: galactokinase [Candidatus Solibacter sp.]|nr:galactokinase [Candidatus Solibacter sp.]